MVGTRHGLAGCGGQVCRGLFTSVSGGRAGRRRPGVGDTGHSERPATARRTVPPVRRRRAGGASRPARRLRADRGRWSKDWKPSFGPAVRASGTGGPGIGLGLRTGAARPGVRVRVAGPAVSGGSRPVGPARAVPGRRTDRAERVDWAARTVGAVRPSFRGRARRSLVPGRRGLVEVQLAEQTGGVRGDQVHPVLRRLAETTWHVRRTCRLGGRVVDASGEALHRAGRRAEATGQPATRASARRHRRPPVRGPRSAASATRWRSRGSPC